SQSDATSAQAVVDEMMAMGGRGVALLGDVSKENDVALIVDRCRSALGDVTSVIHSAAYRSHHRLMDLSLGEWRRPRAVTLDAALFLARHTLPSMLAHDFGRYVFVGGTAMNNGLPVGHAHVATAKAALRGFVRALAQDCVGSGVTANVVSPGTIDTDARRSVAPVIEGWDPVGASVLRRMLRMEEVA